MRSYLTTPLLALALVGCPKADDEVTDDTDTDMTDTDTDMTDTDDTDDTDTDTDAELSTIYELASNTPALSTLKALIDTNGLDGVLDDPSATFTVFAPTNTAFENASVPPTTPASDAIEQILLYHVISGAAVESGDVMTGPVQMSATNADDNAIYAWITADMDGIDINGANVDGTLFDIEASNGVVHVIDGVISPLTALEFATAAGFTELSAAITAADSSNTIIGVLDGTGPITVFAPTNAAFGEAPEGLTGAQLDTVLTSHVLDTTTFTSSVLSTDLSNGDVLTLSGENVTVDTTALTIEGAALNADLLDIHVSNGVVHVLDDVIIPPSLQSN